MASSWEESGDGAVEDGRYSWAMQVYNSACDLNSPTACMKAGDLLRDQLFVDDIGLYMNYAGFFGKGCELGLTESCKRIRAVVAMWEDRCGDGEPEMCVALGLGHMQGYGSGVKDPIAARPAFDFACSKDNAEGCYFLGELLFKGIEEGTPDHPRAELYLSKACNLEYGPGCSLLGSMYENRLVDPPSQNAAAELYSTACIYDDFKTCHSMGDLTAQLSDENDTGFMAIFFYERGCGGGLLESCRALAYALFEGTLGEQDIARAKAIAAPLCDKGEAQLCKDLGILEQ
ncbi:MAG: tetratricopeptide repeat protein [Pseudomonadota bacterium]